MCTHIYITILDHSLTRKNISKDRFDLKMDLCTLETLLQVNACKQADLMQLREMFHISCKRMTVFHWFAAPS